MAVIGNLATTLSVNSAGLTAGLASARNSFASFGSSITGVIGKFGPLAAGLTGIAGAAGFGMLVKNSFASIDSLAKVADSVGLTTEALAGLRRAADRSGVASEALDKGFARMQKTISSAAAAGGSKNFAALGIELDSIRAMKPEDQFFAIADAINNVQDQTDKTRLAMETFGRDGSGILKIMGRGADAARAELAKAAELGLAPSREDAALVEQANDAIADMKDSFMGIANVVAVNVAPVLTGIADRVTKFGIAARKTFEEWLPAIRATGTAISTGVNAALIPIQPLLSMIGETGKSTFGDIREFVLDAALTAEFAFNNLGDVATLAWEKTKLGMVSLWNDMHHLFTAQIPGVLTWFADNWRDIMFTSVDYALTILINLGENIRSVWRGVLDFIQGRGFNVDFTPLTEGFVSTIKSMPEIADREIGAIEQRLMDSVAGLSGNLSEGLGAHLTARREELLGVGKTVGEEMADGFGDAIGQSLAAAQTSGPAALTRGSSEAFSAVLGAMRQSGSDPQAQIAKTNEEQVKLQNRIARALERQEKRSTVELVAGTV